MLVGVQLRFEKSSENCKERGDEEIKNIERVF